MGAYSYAVEHMKRYLALSPDAKDAPAARDQMYVWEGKLQEAKATTSATSSTSEQPALKRGRPNSRPVETK
jgi:hypothetical protein